MSQFDQHVADWLKAKYNLTVQENSYYFKSKEDWYRVFKGDYDLDIKEVCAGPTIFDAAMEYCCCYDGEMGLELEKLTGLEA